MYICIDLRTTGVWEKRRAHKGGAWGRRQGGVLWATSGVTVAGKGERARGLSRGWGGKAGARVGERVGASWHG